MSTSPFRLEGLISQNEFLDRPLQEVIAIDNEAAIILDDAPTIEQIGSRKDKEYRIAVHIADTGLLYDYDLLIDDVLRKGLRRNPEKIAPGRVEAIQRAREELSLGTGGAEGAPSTVVEYSYSGKHQIVDKDTVYFGKSRVLVDPCTYKDYGKLDPDERRKLDEVVVGINQNKGIQLSPEISPREKITQIMVATNRVVAEEVYRRGLPWLYQSNKQIDGFSLTQYGIKPKRHEWFDLEAYTHISSPLQEKFDFINMLNLHAHIENLPMKFKRKNLELIAKDRNRFLKRKFKRTVKKHNQLADIAA